MKASAATLAVGLVIRELRVRRRLTQRSLADRLGVVELTVRQWEAGRRVPSLVDVPRIALALGLSARSLGGRLALAIESGLEGGPAPPAPPS